VFSFLLLRQSLQTLLSYPLASSVV
jgi:hypothetical protein